MNPDRCFFGDYMIEDPDARLYEEVTDVPGLLKQTESYLADFNGVSKRPMNLAIFLFAVEHVSRICRILKQPGGHMLLVGVGGSGRQSLTRLAGAIYSMEVFQVCQRSLGYVPIWSTLASCIMLHLILCAFMCKDLFEVFHWLCICARFSVYLCRVLPRLCIGTRFCVHLCVVTCWHLFRCIYRLCIGARLFIHPCIGTCLGVFIDTTLVYASLFIYGYALCLGLFIDFAFAQTFVFISV